MSTLRHLALHWPAASRCVPIRSARPPSEGLLPGWQQEVFLKETLTFILFYLFIYLLCPHEARAVCPGLVWSPHGARSRPAPGRLQGPGRTAGGSTAQRTATEKRDSNVYFPFARVEINHLHFYFSISLHIFFLLLLFVRCEAVVVSQAAREVTAWFFVWTPL